METLDIIAGLAWDPEIRGFMAVLAGTVVLLGSVWLLVVTNSGVRLGTLIAVAGFFGWMAIMGAIWWIYGIGYVGDAPTWEQVEIVEGTDDEGHLTFAALDEANELRSEELSSAYELVLQAAARAQESYGPDALTMASDDPELIEIQTAWAEFGEVTPASLTDDQTEGLSPAEIADLAAREQARNEDTTLSELAAVAPGLIDQDSAELGGWTLLSTAESGEAQASAIAMILGSGDHPFNSAGEFKVLDAYAIGGKRGLPADPNRWDRIETQVRTALTVKNPTRYGIIQLQQVTPESLANLPGTAPKRPVADPEAPVISVVMIRNLGNLRILPAMVTIGSLLIFLGLCYMMHERDKIVMARRAEFEAS